MLTVALIAIALCLTLATILIVERVRHKREFARLESAIRQQDRRQLGSKEYARAPGHIRSLEKAIFDQLFTAANLKETVIRREKMLSSLVDGLGDAVLVTDKKKRIRFANERARDLLKLPEKVTGTPIRQAISDRQLITWLDQCHTRAESTRTTIELPGRILRGDITRSFEVDIAPLQKNELGGSDVSRIVLHDITERVELEQVRKDFVANASHELRTPLTIINGYLENLIDDGAVDDPEITKKFLKVMRKHGKRLELLVSDMLTISRLESDDSDPVKVELFNFVSCINEVVERLSPVIEAKSAEIIIEIPEDENLLNGDALYWDQILFNLMENALKENDQDGLKLRVKKVESAKDSTIVVEDDGIGIPKDALPFIFKRFYRVDESHNGEKTGTGLGLSIVKRSVEAHGGTIEVASTPGRSTAFTIRVPKQ